MHLTHHPPLPEYEVSGYYEIQNSPKRYCIIDRTAFMKIFSIDEEECLQSEHRAWVETEMKNEDSNAYLIGVKQLP